MARKKIEVEEIQTKFNTISIEEMNDLEGCTIEVPSEEEE